MQIQHYEATDNSSIEQLKETDNYLSESYTKLVGQFSKTASLAQSHSQINYNGPAELSLETVNLAQGENIDEWIDSEHDIQSHIEETDRILDEVFDYIRFVRQEIEPETKVWVEEEAEQFYQVITEIDRIESRYYDIEHELEKIRKEVNEGRKVRKGMENYERIDIEGLLETQLYKEILGPVEEEEVAK